MKPIIFSTPMVKAILEGRKTQTRRIIKSRHESGMFQVSTAKYEPEVRGYYHNRSVCAVDWDERTVDGGDILCPYGEVGDVLYVRETIYQHGHYYTDSFDETGEYETRWISAGATSYVATDERPAKCRVKPSIHMPKAAARIFLKITDIRVERLQDITEEDAKAEGVQPNTCDDPAKCPSSRKLNGCCGDGEYCNYLVSCDGEPCYSALESFKSLWELINGSESWKENPFVWVVSFEKIDKPSNV